MINAIYNFMCDNMRDVLGWWGIMGIKKYIFKNEKLLLSANFLDYG